MFAIYQTGYVVFGTGASVAEAIADANQWLDDRQAPITEADLKNRHHCNDGDLIAIECSEALHREVQTNGGNVVINEVDGVLELAA